MRYGSDGFYAMFVQWRNFIGFEWVYVNDSDDDTGWNENFIAKGKNPVKSFVCDESRSLKSHTKCEAIVVWKGVEMMHAQW